MTIFHPELHPLFETLGYAGGYALYRRERARQGDFLSEEKRWVVIAATAIGALIGSRALGLLEQAPRVALHWQDVLRPGGKTIVGGLLGGQRRSFPSANDTPPFAKARRIGHPTPRYVFQET